MSGAWSEIPDEAGRLLSAVVASAMDAILVVDEDQRIVVFNAAAERMFGCAAAEALGSSLERFLPPRYRADHARWMHAFGEAGVSSRTMGWGRVTGQRPDGTEFPIEVSIACASVSGRRMFTAIIRDVSERHRAESERERLVADLEARQAELERFTYAVSHDLKSPLVTIKGFLGFLERDLARGDTARVATDLDHIRSAASTMDRLLEDLLQLSRVGRVVHRPGEFDPAEVAREAVTAVAGRLTERSVRVHVPEHLPTVVADRHRVLEVFQNLVENAAKYAADGADPQVWISADVDGTFVRFRVRDNGPGIDPAYHERVFGLFTKLDRDSEGSGIGLAIVKRIVETHGGRVWVESTGTPGGGTVFGFSLPRPEASRDRSE
ncbi:MAG: PAS domain-containing sensor histidine kinase [Acidobacteria bacterium]|nr:PAS domain-containing sensor histidine kinase [Acidobacteriota bacterium]